MPLVGVKKAVDWRQAKPVTKLCEHTPADFFFKFMKSIDIVYKISYNTDRFMKGRDTMASTNVNIRMDSDLKTQFEKFCSDMGMSMSTAFTVFAKKAVREYRIPFEIGAEIPNAATIKALQDVKNGVGLSRPFSSVEELMEDLNADD